MKNTIRMKSTLRNSIIAASIAIIGGCASTPENAGQADDLRGQYNQMATVTENKELAPLAMKDAEDALNKLDKIIDSKASEKDVAHQLYIVERKIDIAKEAVEIKRAENTISEASGQRKDIIIDTRTKEAQEAKAKANAMEDRANAAEAQANELMNSARKLESEIKELNAKETSRGLALTLNSILFELNSSALKPGSKRILEKVAEFLNSYPDRHIVIEGFTDSTGEESYNEKLSEERANSVKQELVNASVSDTRIVTKGLGEAYAVASNDTSVGRQQNRRVEIIVSNTNGKAVSER